MVSRCAGRQRDGRQCGAPPIKGEPYCLWHSPEREDEAAEARRLGGLRRRREKTLSAAYDFSGLGSVEAIRRILEIAVVDALGLDNSVARARVLIAAAMAATKILEVGELEDRLARLEAAASERATPIPVFPVSDTPRAEVRA